MPSSDVDALYELPREEFTKARNDLARELRQAGDREAADEVKRLAKPSQAAWALNRLVRQHPEAASELLDVAARLRDAQASALEGDASELREVSREERDIVSRLAAEAGAAHPGGAALQERIGSTLRGVIAGGDEVQELFRHGRLTEDLEAAGFGTAAAVPAPASAPRRPRRREPGEVNAAREEARARQREAKETHAEVRRLAHAVERLEERAATAREEANRAEHELEEARARVQEAEQRLAEETSRAETAAARVETLEGEVGG